MEKNRFSQFNLQNGLLQAVERLKFKKPTEIQEKVIPKALSGLSVIGQSHTGSGKTHAYLLPLFSRIDPELNEVQCVITAPTRELATQIFEDVKNLISFSGNEEKISAKLLIGGTDKKRMAEKLKNVPHVVVGTPGRILEMVNQEALSIYEADAFVIDEADLMIDLGFINEVDQLLVKSRQDIQLLVFSATIPQRLEHFLKKYMENPLHVKIDNGISPETLEHRLIPLKHRSEGDMILKIAEVIQPYLAMVFTNSKEQADKLSAELIGKGLNVGLLHGGLSPRERKRVLKDIQSLRFEFIVATDLASRGIDIKGVSHVINAQLPKEEEFYIHRSGRTARAGMEGVVISLYREEDIKLIEKLEEKGIEFQFSDVKNGSWTEANAWNKRSTRKKTDADIDQQAWKQVRKAKKVKPGYKKKMKHQQQSVKRQLSKKAGFKKKR
ncbi:DEAD/DEAH box helicase [Aciduricibacillus chroicocephali]|uniref:DEAD/DEAH box helicase n=1 Tax=Aciduricibacillus chroicocephali TaxID=3054939 RepID=A0ABY9KRP8_9BACI|nr:DEAD/DEAH box helicase [Bacillaceae bacterium 44XB]